MGVVLRPKPEFKLVHMPPVGEAQIRPFQSEAAIAANREYGQIICHCERVSLGEIRDALHASIPAVTLDGLRRRTRCLQGRCQGFHCHAEVTRLLAEELGEKPNHVIGCEE